MGGSVRDKSHWPEVCIYCPAPKRVKLNDGLPNPVFVLHPLISRMIVSPSGDEIKDGQTVYPGSRNPFEKDRRTGGARCSVQLPNVTRARCLTRTRTAEVRWSERTQPNSSTRSSRVGSFPQARCLSGPVYRRWCARLKFASGLLHN